MDDENEDEFGPGEVSLLPPGNDAWVVGDEPVVVIDISGMAEYAKQALGVLLMVPQGVTKIFA